MNNETRQLLQDVLNNLLNGAHVYPTALQERIEAELAKPVQEPIWYTNTLDAECDTPKVISCAEKHGCAIEAGDCSIPLYTSPPAREPLSRKEIYDLAEVHGSTDEMERAVFEDDDLIDFARAIEAAHGIGVKP